MKSRVKDVMTKTVVVVSDSTPFKEIVALMKEYRVSALPVVDRDAKVIGIVSEADLLLKEAFEPDEELRLFERRQRRIDRSKAAGLVASQVMTSPAVTLTGEATLMQAARLMRDRRIKRLPVIDEDGRIEGIVSRADLLKVFLRPDGEIRREVERDVIQRTLWMEPTRIRVTVHDGVVMLEGTVEQRSMIAVLTGLIHGVDGVVGVESRLDYDVDDVSLRPDMMGPWGLVPYGAPKP